MQRKGRNAATDANADIAKYRLSGTPGHLLRRCQQRAIEIFFEEVGPRRLTPRQFALLVTIAQRPGLSQTDLVDVTGIDRSTVGDMLERLLKRGLVRRRRSGRDQRTNTLYVQPAGLKAVHDTIPAVERAQARILGPLPEDMRPAFVAALRLMAGIVETPAPKPSR